RFDESEVKLWNMELAGSLYPDHLEFKYPKAGEDNAKVTIHVYDLEGKKTVMVDVGKEVDQYIPRIKWTNDNEKLAIMRMNRLQNKVDILLANASDGSTDVILTEESETYIKEPADDTWYFLSSSDDFLWRSERSGFMHIYRYNMSGELVGAVTEGEWAVDELIGVDEENEAIYYTSTEDSPLERHLYRISMEGKKKKKLTKIAGTHNVTASSAFNYFVDSYSNTATPTQTELKDAKGKTIRALETNERLKKNVARHKVTDPSFFSFAYTPAYRGENSAEISLNGFMIKPSDFDETKQYPVLMFVYGGPGSQEVTNAWGHGDPFNYMWFQMLAQKGYIVACVDNRGTGGRGRDFRAGTYANLGRYETMDQVAAAKYLGDLPYIDKERIGIWGWSYGGYMTSLCMTKGGGVFKMGIAVAPVTNWRFYDTIYTERYLKRPQENARGYDENSPINFADQLEGKLLVIHGTGDDNVHFQNTVEFTDALIAANKQFDVFFYPNRNHGIYGGNTRYHLYTQMTNYILENL
ncbi:MAG: alpha/beta fold hydrolase, partial [Bacteroidota bacterium]